MEKDEIELSVVKQPPYLQDAGDTANTNNLSLRAVNPIDIAVSNLSLKVNTTPQKWNPIQKLRQRRNSQSQPPTPAKTGQQEP
jgi:hypothetical protein